MHAEHTHVERARARMCERNIARCTNGRKEGCRRYNIDMHWTYLCCLRCRVRDPRTSSTRAHRPWQQDPVRASAWSMLFSRQTTGEKKERVEKEKYTRAISRVRSLWRVSLNDTLKSVYFITIFDVLLYPLCVSWERWQYHWCLLMYGESTHCFRVHDHEGASRAACTRFLK